MAGIAFRLQKLLNGEDYSSLIKAYLFSGIISSGPFLVVILILGSVRLLSKGLLGLHQSNLLMSIIVYIYAFSMIGVSPFIYISTRYLADQYFLKRLSSFTPSFLSLLYIIFGLQSVVALIYLSYTELNFRTEWIMYSLYLITSGIWIAMIYISAARNYMWIVWSFVIGACLSILLAWLLGKPMGLDGYLLGFCVGQFVCFVMLTYQIFKEFGYEASYDFGFIEYFKTHPYLACVGFFYFSGIWIDKIIIWFSPYGDTITKGIRVSFDYDTPMFLAYLTVIPSMAFFLVRMETSFVQKYHSYYTAVRERGSLFDIKERQKAMMKNLSGSFQEYAISQGILTGIIILFLYEITLFFNLNTAQIGILRISLLGSFLLMGFVMLLNITFYFDFQKDAFYTCLILFVTNSLFTFMTVHIGFESLGFGYGLSTFITTAVAFFVLNRKLKNLNYWTFMKQPLFLPQFKFEAESRSQDNSDSESDLHSKHLKESP